MEKNAGFQKILTFPMLLTAICLFFFFGSTISTSAQKAFPGAIGFGAKASGGRGGQVIYVTNLNISGPGSLQDALNQSGPRYILFKVAGVIDGTIEVPYGHGDFTLAGQTSPGGITVRGFQMYNDENPSVNNVIIRHLRSRIGDINLHPTGNWLGSDGITIGGVKNIIVDHCSFQHANDEAVDISRTSSLTIQNCVLGETLGDHGYLGGILINYSSADSPLDSISIHNNVWNRIGGRMPELSCESPYCNNKTIHLELSNNLYWDPQIELWYEGATGNNDGHFYLNMNAVNNLYHSRNSYTNAMYHFDLLNFANNHLYYSGNEMNLDPSDSDYQLFYCCNDFYQNNPNTDMGVADRLTDKHPYYNANYIETADLQSYIANYSGAFPRDPMDERFARTIADNVIIDLPVNQAAADDAFLTQATGLTEEDSDGDGMPDYWETLQGLDNNVQDHNGTQLSQYITGESGYTNLECYLNCLSDALVYGNDRAECNIGGTVSKATGKKQGEVTVYPNPVRDQLIVLNKEMDFPVSVSLFNLNGRLVETHKISSELSSIPTTQLVPGVYIIKVTSTVTGEMKNVSKIVVLH